MEEFHNGYGMFRNSSISFETEMPLNRRLERCLRLPWLPACLAEYGLVHQLRWDVNWLCREVRMYAVAGQLITCSAEEKFRKRIMEVPLQMEAYLELNGRKWKNLEENGKVRSP